MLNLRVAVALVVSGLLGAGIVAAVIAAPAPVRTAAERFEFGELRQSYTRAGTNHRGGFPEKSTVLWVTAKATVETDNWEAMAKALKAPAAEKGMTEDNHRMRVLDQLDGMGWDFVMDRNLVVDRARTAGFLEAWSFKRKVGTRQAP